MALDRGVDSQLEAAIGYILQQIEGRPSRNLDNAPPPPTQLGL